MSHCRHCDREFVDDHALQQVVAPIPMLFFYDNSTHQSTDEIHLSIESLIIALRAIDHSDTRLT